MHAGFDIARVSWDNFPTLDTFLDEEEVAIPNSLAPGRPSRLEHGMTEVVVVVAVVEVALVVLEIVVATAAAETVALAAEAALVVAVVEIVAAAETVEIAAIVAVVVVTAAVAVVMVVAAAMDEGYNLLQDAVQDLVASAH